MAAQKNKPKVYVKFKKSSTATKVALGVAVGVSLVTLLVLSAATSNMWNKVDDLKDQILEEQQEQEDLEDKIENVGSLEGFEDIAQSEGYEYPDTTVIVPGN